MQSQPGNPLPPDIWAWENSNSPSDPEAPLEEWLFGIARRCARRRALRAYPAYPAMALHDAIRTVFELFHANLKNLLISVPYSAPGTGHAMVRFRLNWPVYCDIARAADDRLAGVFHSNHPFVDGVETTTIGGGRGAAIPTSSADAGDWPMIIIIAAAIFGWCWIGSAIVEIVAPLTATAQ